MKHWMFFILMLSLVSGTLPQLGKQSSPSGARLEWDACWFPVPAFKTVHCGYFFPSDASSLRLPVVVIQNPTSAKIGPLLYLTGGPGAATGLDEDSIENWWNWLEENDWASEVVFFDQRGTGLSQPHLECPEITAMVHATLNQALTSQQQLTLWKQAAGECYTRLQESGIDLTSYTSSHNSHDVGELMELLGGADWNLYGVSYGTRLALAVIRDYPNKIRSAVLDSVYPPEVDELTESPFVYDNALTTLFQGCQTDSRCRNAFPHLEASFQQLLQKFKEVPVKFTVLDPNSNQSMPVLINDDRFIDLIFYSLYSWDTIQTLPMTIETALKGNYEPLQPLVEDYADWLLNKDFSQAVYLSVECHDSDPSLTREQFLANVAQFPRVKKFVENQWDYDLCQVWQVGHAARNFQKPVVSQIPTLFLAGEYDPVTPPIWAQRAAHHFSQGFFVKLPSVGHGAVESDFCAVAVVRDFLRNPTQKPSNECLFWPSDANFVVEVY